MKPGVIKILGIEGLALILFGLLAFLFAPVAREISLVLFGLGGVCLAVYVAFGWKVLRAGVASRSARFGANAATYTLIVLAILVLVNFVVARHPAQWDATSAKVNTLSDQSVKVLDGLAADAQILHFQKTVEAGPMERLLDRYAKRSARVTYKVVDPDKDPQAVQNYEITRYGDSVVLLEGRKHKFSGATEEDVTNALLQASKSGKKTVYFVEGHGEPSIDDGGETGYKAIAKAMGNESIEATRLLLASETKIPADAAAVVVAGPKKPLLAQEVRILADYVKGGGHAFFLLDPAFPSGLEPLVQEYGVTVQDTAVVEKQLRLFEGATLGVEPIVEDYGDHPITKDFRERTVFPLVRSLATAKEPPTGVTLTEIAKTSAQSWADTGVQQLLTANTVEFTEGQDIQGPVAVAVAVEKKLGAPPAAEGAEPPAPEPGESGPAAKIVVIGDADFADNKYANYLFNTDFFLNSVSWLIGEEGRIAIRPRSYAPSVVQLTEQERGMLFYVGTLVLPQLMAMIGIAVFIRRQSS